MTTAYRTGTANGTATTGAVSLSSTGLTTIAGDVAVVFAGAILQADPISSVLDTYGNVWTLALRYAYTAYSFSVYNYAYVVPLLSYGSGHTFTFNCPAQSYLEIAVAIFSGCNQGSPLDGTVAGYLTGSNSQSHAGASITTALPGSALAAFVCDSGASGSDSFTAGSGFTIGPSALGNGSTYSPQMIQYQANVAANTYAGAWTSSGFTNGSSIIVGLAASAAGSVPGGSGGLGGGVSGDFISGGLGA